ncbi:MAG: ABC transporter substrate-binding protein [Pseudomonadota bacterium]
MPLIRQTLFAAALALAWMPAAADEAAEARALATAERLVEGAHGALVDPGLSEAARADQLRETVAAAFAFDIWERFLLGDRASALSDAQKGEFRDRLPGFLAHLYANQFGKGLEEKPEIRDARPARSDTLVRASIPRANGKALPVDWRVRDFDGRGALVIDVMVGGISFLVLKREEFASILDDKGPDGLLAFMADNSL